MKREREREGMRKREKVDMTGVDMTMIDMTGVDATMMDMTKVDVT